MRIGRGCRRPGRSKETGGVAIATNLLPSHLLATRMHEAAPVVPKAIAPARARPSKAATRSGTTLGLL